GPAKATPGPIRNTDVGKDGGIKVGPSLGQSPRVKTNPVTNLPMRVFAVVWGPTVGEELSGFEGADDYFLVDGNAGDDKAVGRSSGKPVWKKSGFHGCALLD